MPYKLAPIVLSFFGSIYKIAKSIYRSIRHKLIDVRIKRLARCSPLKIIIGAAETAQPGWISTNIEHLNLLDCNSWERYFKKNSIDEILAEHVWEHLTKKEAILAAKNCYRYLKPQGYIRVAVPDGFHPSKDYINAVKPGGTGAGSDDHKILYNYKTLSQVFEGAGFEVELLEYFDEVGEFHCKQWNPDKGMITRSSKYDERNKNGQLNYTSIIIDAWKR